MKTRNLLGKVASAVVVGAAMGFGASMASAAGFDLGDATYYAVLFEGAGGHHLNINNGPGLNGLAAVGNIGIDNTGLLAVSGPLVINGNVQFANTVRVQGNYNNGGNVVINGTVTGGSTRAHNDMVYLNNLSSTVGRYAGAALSVNINNGQSRTINASDGNFVNGNSVFTVGAFNFGGGSTLTIHGDGLHNVILNFFANEQFQGRILLTGGLTSDQVLFNFTGGANLTGGDTLQGNSNGAILTGTFLDPNGAMSLTHSVLDGRFFGGDTQDMAIVSGAEVVAPPTPDASSTLGLLGIALLGLGSVRHKLQIPKL